MQWGARKREREEKKKRGEMMERWRGKGECGALKREKDIVHAKAVLLTNKLRMVYSCIGEGGRREEKREQRGGMSVCERKKQSIWWREDDSSPLWYYLLASLSQLISSLYYSVCCSV